jgi:hypothetical protein
MFSASAMRPGITPQRSIAILGVDICTSIVHVLLVDPVIHTDVGCACVTAPGHHNEFWLYGRCGIRSSQLASASHGFVKCTQCGTFVPPLRLEEVSAAREPPRAHGQNGHWSADSRVAEHELENTQTHKETHTHTHTHAHTCPHTDTRTHTHLTHIHSGLHKQRGLHGQAPHTTWGRCT